MRLPSTYTVLFFLIAILVLSTWFIPGGRYIFIPLNEDASLKTDTAPLSVDEYLALDKENLNNFLPRFEDLGKARLGFSSFLLAPARGFAAAWDIIIFVLFLGGFMHIVIKTGALERAIKKMAFRIGKTPQRRLRILVYFFVLFALGGSLFGMSEETLPYYAIFLPFLVMLGFDTLIPLIVVFLGSSIGVLASSVNPYATGIALELVGLPLFAGMSLRILLFVAFVSIAVIFMLLYAQKILKDPLRSLLPPLDQQEYEKIIQGQIVTEIEENQEKIKKNTAHLPKSEHTLILEEPKLSLTDYLVLLIFASAFLILIAGVMPFESLGIPLPSLNWWFSELSGLFFLMTLILFLLLRVREPQIWYEKRFTSHFIAGCAEFLPVSFIIALSRSISIVLTEGAMDATLLHSTVNLFRSFSPVFFVNASLFYYTVFSFFVPSTTAVATLTMPIYASLSRLLGVDVNIIVIAYQVGVGLANILTPLSGILMASLVFTRVPWAKWFHYVWPIWITIYILTSFLLSFLTIIGT